MSEDRIIGLARRYVELSNAHDLTGIGQMLADDATYSSNRAGTHDGRQAILKMMETFFQTFPDAHWAAQDYTLGTSHTVHFSFSMTATDTAADQQITRRGTEDISFTSAGLIAHVEVSA